MKRLRFHPAAKAELAHAIAWYENEQPGLGLQFLQKLDEIVARIESNPDWYAVENDEGERFSLVGRYSYYLVYVDFADWIWGVAVAHTRRRPRYWAARGPDDV